MSSNPLTNFHYHEISNQAQQTLFLLHGTGGNEQDLLPLVSPLAEHFNFVGLRGNVLEHGMARFFERSSAGVFNQESIRIEVHRLAEFLKAWSVEKHIAAKDMAFVGYSNGATMILALLFLYPELVERAVLLHPMLPFEPPSLELAPKKMLLTYGQNDQMIPALLSKQVHKSLTTNGADVRALVHPGGHEVRAEERQALISFLTNTN